MITTLKLYHYPHKMISFQEQVHEGDMIWKTCLRTFVFVKDNTNRDYSGDYYEGDAAYSFLLATICGLHSPMIGETEIVAQFKQFIKEKPMAIKTKIAQQLLKDCKELRTRYLKGRGGQSYGSYTQSMSHGHDSIVFLGNGALTSEILPIIKKFSGNIIIQARNLEKTAELQKRFSNICAEDIHGHKALRDNALIVIAAPMSTDILNDHLSRNFVNSTILDMRALGHNAPLELPAHLTCQSLDEIFSHIKKTQEKMKVIAELIADEIQEKSAAWNLKAISRPFGWEDLCY